MRLTGAVISIMAIAGSLANADAIALQPGASLSHETNFGVQVRDVQSLPFQDTASLTGASGSNTGIYNLAPTNFSLTLRQHGSATNFFGRSDGQFEFTVPDATSYAINTLFRSQGAAEWTGYIDLVNESSGQTLYRNVRFGPGGVLPNAIPAGADSSPTGAATGSLQPGNTYLLRYVLYSMVGTAGGNTLTGGPDGGAGSLDPTRGAAPPPRFTNMGVDGSIGVTFGPEGVVVPLPPAAWAGLALMGAMVLPQAYRRLRRSAASV